MPRADCSTNWLVVSNMCECKLRQLESRSWEELLNSCIAFLAIVVTEFVCRVRGLGNPSCPGKTQLKARENRQSYKRMRNGLLRLLRR